MIWLQKYRLLIYLIVLSCFGYGLFNYWSARIFQPSVSGQNPVNPFILATDKSGYPLERYQQLRNGSLFFGEPIRSVETTPTEVVFQSKLIVWGVTIGKTNRAVVGFDPSSTQDTQIVKPGDTVQDEHITAIGSNYILVRNSTGEGKIYIRD